MELTQLQSYFEQGLEKIKEYQLMELSKIYTDGVKIRNSHGECFVKHPIRFGNDNREIYDAIGKEIYYKGVWAEIMPEEEKKEEFKEGDEVIVCCLNTTSPKPNNVEGVVSFIKGSTIWVKIINETYAYSPIELVLKRKEEEPEAALKLPLDNMSTTTVPLHDQIREGRWRFIMKSAHININTCGSSTYAEACKIDAYIKLLALSKVLNEGKEAGREIFIVNMWDGKMSILGYERDYHRFPIDIYILEDAAFALHFAEKEWKIFYNSEK